MRFKAIASFCFLLESIVHDCGGLVKDLRRVGRPGALCAPRGKGRDRGAGLSGYTFLRKENIGFFFSGAAARL
ncbi:hypothetical protein D5272_04450 [bacterium D16-76]|nr:hypothetical protein [bacterium D16-76]